MREGEEHKEWLEDFTKSRKKEKKKKKKKKKWGERKVRLFQAKTVKEKNEGCGKKTIKIFSRFY